MHVSQNGTALIEKFEGLRLDAYLDPVGIPTIGYGTIRYPDGHKVRLGDRITEQEAEAFLKFECDAVAKGVTHLVKVPLNQNQFDALVSFSYNLGLGSLEESTLLRKLNRGDYQGAADEFPRWNKGIVNGVKQELKGLTRRRSEERELFSKVGGEGTPITVEESPRDKVTLLEGYRQGEKDVIVAWQDDQVVEILTLENSSKDSWVAAVRQYPHAEKFHVAPAEKAIPEGERIVFSVRGSAMAKVEPPRALKRTLARGCSGPDVKRLQERLKDLGYYDGPIDGDFGRRTDEGVRDFQTRFFATAEADGKVGPKTWAKLWGEVTPLPPVAEGPSIPGRHYLTLTRTNRRDEVGCTVLELDYFKDGQRKDSLEVCSGSPYRQFFHTGSDSVSGSFEPLPEGKWYVHDIEWADGKDNYSGKIWNRGLGPAKILLDYQGPGTTRRSAILIHIDWNRRYERGAGTAGCVGIYNAADFKKLVVWLRESDPRDLFVDWGLGTCPQP